MKVALTGGGVVGVAMVGALAFVGYKIVKNKDAIIAAFNPTSDQNLAYKGATSASVALQKAVGLSGEHKGYSYDDHFFAAIDLMNPWNESDLYAKEVYGINRDLNKDKHMLRLD